MSLKVADPLALIYYEHKAVIQPAELQKKYQRTFLSVSLQVMHILLLLIPVENPMKYEKKHSGVCIDKLLKAPLQLASARVMGFVSSGPRGNSASLPLSVTGGLPPPPSFPTPFAVSSLPQHSSLRNCSGFSSLPYGCALIPPPTHIRAKRGETMDVEEMLW